METSFGSIDKLENILLVCGIFSAIIFSGTDLFAGLLTPGYHFDSQSASLLSATNSTTRKFVLPLNIISSLLLLAFCAGIWMAAGQNWILQIAAGLLACSAILSIFAFSFYPFHPDEPLNAKENKMNIIIMGISVLSFFLAICFGAVGNHNWFRYFSIGLIILFFIVDILATRGMKPSFGGNPGPMVGIQERTMIYGEMLWLVLQAIVLLDT